ASEQDCSDHRFDEPRSHSRGCDGAGTRSDARGMVSIAHRRQRGTAALNEPVPKALRLFIAVTIPEKVKTEIEKAQSELRRSVPSARARWTTREQFHLTLRFLGSVESERIDALTEAVRGACQGFAALELRAERIGFFPGPRRPRVVWAGIHDQQGQLGQVHRAVTAATQGF